MESASTSQNLLTQPLSLAENFSIISSCEADNVFVPPKRYPVYCGSCWVPIKDITSLKKHRTIKRHFCQEYPTSYQKVGFVKRDYRRSWRRDARERIKYNNRSTTSTTTPTTTTTTTALPSSAASMVLLAKIPKLVPTPEIRTFQKKSSSVQSKQTSTLDSLNVKKFDGILQIKPNSGNVAPSVVTTISANISKTTSLTTTPILPISTTFTTPAPFREALKLTTSNMEKSSQKEKCFVPPQGERFQHDSDMVTDSYFDDVFSLHDLFTSPCELTKSNPSFTKVQSLNDTGMTSGLFDANSNATFQKQREPENELIIPRSASLGLESLQTISGSQLVHFTGQQSNGSSKPQPSGLSGFPSFGNVVNSSSREILSGLQSFGNSSGSHSSEKVIGSQFSRMIAGSPSNRNVAGLQSSELQPLSVLSDKSSDDDGAMDTAPSASPFQPFQAITGNLGGYFTYSKHNCFVKETVGGSQPQSLTRPSHESQSQPYARPVPSSSSLPQPLLSLRPQLPPSTSAPQLHPTQPRAQPPKINSTKEESEETRQPPSPSDEARSFLDQLRAFRDERFLTDIFLVIGEKRVYAHKIVLSAKSTFFKELIDKCVNTPSYGLRLDFGFSYDAFLIALDYIYGFLAEDKIDYFNAAEVKVVAQKLELDGLKIVCEKILEASIDAPTEEGTGLTASTIETVSPRTSTTTTTATTTAPPVSPFSAENSFAELSNICAEFTATVLNSDAAGDAAPLVDFERVDSNRTRKSDPPLSSVDVSRKTEFNFGGSLLNNELHVLQRQSSRRDSFNSALMTPNPHLDGDNEILGGFLHSGSFGSLGENPFEDIFDLNDGTMSTLFGSPILNNNNNINNNNNSLSSSFETSNAQQKLVLSPPVVVHPPKIPLFASPTKKEQPPTQLLSSPLKRPLSYQRSAPPTSTKEFSAMLSTQYSAPAPAPSTKSYMNCIICHDAIEGQTKIEQWIRLCQHLADKHKKVIDREILTKQFGIQDSAIAASVLGDDGAMTPASSGSQGNLVLKAPLHVKPGEELVVNAAPTSQHSSSSSCSSSSLSHFASSTGAAENERRGEAKSRLNHFMCQKRILNTELMNHVQKIPSLVEGKDDNYGCRRCGKEFDSLTPVQRHLVVNHSVPLPGLQILMCSHCGNKDVDREENMSETGPSKACNVCKHRMSRMV